MNIELELNGLNCTSCADKIESLSNKLSGVQSSSFNFVTKKLDVIINDSSQYEIITKEIIDIVKDLEPEVDVVDLTKKPNKMELELNGLNCSDCARNIEDTVQGLQEVESLSFNFVTKKLIVFLSKNANYEKLYNEIVSIVNRLEPDVDIIDLNESYNIKTLNLKLRGLDCVDCAKNIEKFTKSLKGVEDAQFNFVNSIYTVKLREEINVSEVKMEVEDIINTIEPGVEIIDMGSGKLEKENISDKTSKIDKRQVLTIISSAVLASIPWLFGFSGKIRFLFYFLSYLIIGNKIIKQAFNNIKAGLWFDENFLMTIATISAFIIGEYPEAVMVMLLYQIGETLQGMAVNHSRDSITALMDIRPDSVNLEKQGEVVVVDPSEVSIGDIIVVRPGEKVALDGIIIEGSSSLDTSNITGESVPRKVVEGEEVLSGVVNLQGLLRIKVMKNFGESTISKILDLVENASSKKAETENFITKFSRYYTPIVVFIAIALAFIPPLLGYGHIKDWLYNASIFLVISCPCALVISVPLGFFGGLGAASKSGILVKGGNYLEALADVDTVVFDKTGTVTEGIFDVTDIEIYGSYSEDEVIKIAAHGEAFSNHPIAKSIVNKYEDNINNDIISNYEEIAGKGISVDIDQKKVLLGNYKLMRDLKVDYKKSNRLGSLVYVAIDGEHIATIVVSDKIKETAYRDLQDLKKVGVNNTIMLSGDKIETVEEVAKLLKIDKAYGELLPQDKVTMFEDIIIHKSQKSKVAFVGDGVNDAPVLARADVGIAMGGLGSDAAIEASDIVIMTDDIGKIASGIKIGRNTRKIVIQNISLALGVKLIVLTLGAFGQATMWQAVFADVGVSIIAILNSIRALKLK